MNADLDNEIKGDPNKKLALCSVDWCLFSVHDMIIRDVDREILPEWFLVSDLIRSGLERMRGHLNLVLSGWLKRGENESRWPGAFWTLALKLAF